MGLKSKPLRRSLHKCLLINSYKRKQMMASNKRRLELFIGDLMYYLAYYTENEDNASNQYRKISRLYERLTDVCDQHSLSLTAIAAQGRIANGLNEPELRDYIDHWLSNVQTQAHQYCPSVGTDVDDVVKEYQSDSEEPGISGPRASPIAEAVAPNPSPVSSQSTDDGLCSPDRLSSASASDEIVD